MKLARRGDSTMMAQVKVYELSDFLNKVGLFSQEEVAALGVEKHSVEVGYKDGDLVKIISGPLEGYTGTVKTVDTENNSVCVILSMFGRETPVDLELDQISLEN